MIGVVFACAVVLQVSFGATRFAQGPCPAGPQSVGISVSANALAVTQEPVSACPADTVTWSKKSNSDTRSYAVQFNDAAADACGWGGNPKNIPATCTIQNLPPTGAPGDKYTITCNAACNGAVDPLDPHVIIM